VRPAQRLNVAASVRNVLGPVLRLAYPSDVWGAHHLPMSGPVLVVGDQPELLAGGLVKAAAPRPVHVIGTPAAMQAVPPALMQAAGDLPCVQPGIDAAASALHLLASDEAVVALGPTPAPGYLAVASGAPIVTVVVIGAAGRVSTDPPRLRARIEVRFGPARDLGVPGDPCAIATVRAAGERIRQMIVDARVEAFARHGGPFTESGAR